MEHFGPIVIQVPVIIAITDVLSQTIALLAQLIDADDRTRLRRSTARSPKRQAPPDLGGAKQIAHF